MKDFTEDEYKDKMNAIRNAVQAPATEPNIDHQGQLRCEDCGHVINTLHPTEFHQGHADWCRKYRERDPNRQPGWPLQQQADYHKHMEEESMARSRVGAANCMTCNPKPGKRVVCHGYNADRSEAHGRIAEENEAANGAGTEGFVPAVIVKDNEWKLPARIMPRRP